MANEKEAGKATTANPAKPNDGPTAPAPSQGSPATGGKAAPRRWGQPSGSGDWVKLRSLVARTLDKDNKQVGDLDTSRVFNLTKVTEATIVPETGPSAGVPRDSYVFELSTGKLFSVNKTDSIGHQVTAFGVPPTGRYYIEAVPSGKSGTGDALLLRPYPPADATPTA